MTATFRTLAAVVCLIGLAATTPAQAEEQTITVTVIGEAQAKPDTLVISGAISENSEKLKDAVTAFRDTHRRTLASIEAMKVENLKVETNNLAISLAGDQQMANQFGIQEPGEPKQPGSLTISQSVKLTVGGLDKLEQAAVIDLVVKVMDGTKEAGINLSSMDEQAMMMMRFGMGMPSSGGAVFTLSDPEALRKEAMKDAIKKARTDAAMLAELAGAKLGKVVAISDNGGGGPEAMNPMTMWYGVNMEQAEPFTSTTYEPIKVGKPLSVTFQLITE